jgi:hypothetical protein
MSSVNVRSFQLSAYPEVLRVTRCGDRRLLPRHRHQEFLAFLRQVAKAYPSRKLHIVCDNYGTRTHPDMRAWLDKHPGSPCTSRRRLGRG